jgi:hypothetical protein
MPAYSSARATARPSLLLPGVSGSLRPVPIGPRAKRTVKQQLRAYGVRREVDEVDVVETVEGSRVEMVKVANRTGETDGILDFRITSGGGARVGVGHGDADCDPTDLTFSRR